jgi:hypothetical protein
LQELQVPAAVEEQMRQLVSEQTGEQKEPERTSEYPVLHPLQMLREEQLMQLATVFWVQSRTHWPLTTL